MKFPVIITNFKTYEESCGDNAADLAERHQEIAEKTGVNFVCVVSALDIRLVLSKVSLPVFAQHFDPVQPGKTTGAITLYGLRVAGAKGSLLNHAERNVPIEQIEESLKLAHDHNFEVVVCAKDAQEAGEIAKLKFPPTAIAVEPPELIGGDISVTSANPKIIEDSVKAVGDIPLLVGAGIKTGEDVRMALKLGAKGVLLASGVTCAANPEKALFDLAKGIL